MNEWLFSLWINVPIIFTNWLIVGVVKSHNLPYFKGHLHNVCFVQATVQTSKNTLKYINVIKVRKEKAAKPITFVKLEHENKLIIKIVANKFSANWSTNC